MESTSGNLVNEDMSSEARLPGWKSLLCSVPYDLGKLQELLILYWRDRGKGMWIEFCSFLSVAAFLL